ncbi:GD20244 [Drosophila simulans]|uniref:GD20244 n=1 Tax=Drosophila simulans TaxID=7240 RepID=B4QVS9_DROSI|nr:GD20244 [Drosophila simulans]
MTSADVPCASGLSYSIYCLPLRPKQAVEKAHSKEEVDEEAAEEVAKCPYYLAFPSARESDFELKFLVLANTNCPSAFLLYIIIAFQAF